MARRECDRSDILMPPILLKQFCMFYADPTELQAAATPMAANGHSHPAGEARRPIGVVFWAIVNAEVAERLSQGVTKLRPQDWQSGKADPTNAQAWVIEAIAPFGGADEMMQDLKTGLFANRDLHLLRTDPTGQRVEVV